MGTDRNSSGGSGVGIIGAMILADLSKRLNMLQKYVMKVHQNAIIQMAGALEEDDKRINDLQDKIRSLEKQVAELKRTNKQK